MDSSVARAQYQTVLMVDTERNVMYRREDNVRREPQVDMDEALRAWLHAEQRSREDQQRRREGRERRRERELWRGRGEKCRKILLWVRGIDVLILW